MSDKMVLLIKCVDMGQAMVCRSLLEDKGIPVYLQGENHRALLGLVGSFIELRILVPEENLAEAKRILEGLENEELQEGELVEDLMPVDIPVERGQPFSATGTPFKWWYLFLPFFGFGILHWSAGAYRRALVLMSIDIFAVYRWDFGDPAFMVAHFFVIVADAVGGFLAMVESNHEPRAKD